MTPFQNLDFSSWNHGDGPFVNPTDGQEILEFWDNNRLGGGGSCTFERDGDAVTLITNGQEGLSQEVLSSGYTPGTQFLIELDVEKVSGTTLSYKIEGTFGGIFYTTPTFTITSPQTISFNPTMGGINGDISVTIIQSGTTGVKGKFSNMSFGVVTTLSLDDTLTMDDDADAIDEKNFADTLTMSEALAKTVEMATFPETVSMAAVEKNAPVKSPIDVLVLSEVVDVHKNLGPTDTLYLGEWLTIEKVPAGRWTNSNG
jgi:hypothetical protein